MILATVSRWRTANPVKYICIYHLSFEDRLDALGLRIPQLEGMTQGPIASSVKLFYTLGTTRSTALAYSLLSTHRKMSSLRFGCVSDINVACARVAFGAVVCYCALVSAVVVLFDGERAHLEPAERTIAGLSASALSASLLLRMAPLVTPGLRFLPPGFDRDKKTKSGLTTGVAWLSYTVNFIAAATSWIFSYFALPIVRDPFTGCRIHLVRWCEWSVLAFVMTFLIEVADERGPRYATASLKFLHFDLSLSLSLPPPRERKRENWKRARRPAFDLAIWQGLSTSCGFLLPLCPNFVCWGLAMMFALAVNFALILRWRRRRADFVAARAFAAAPRESVLHAGAAEVSARIGFSYYLLSSCLCIWSLFFVTYVAYCVAKVSGLETRVAPSWPFCVNAVVDFIAKLGYSAVIVDAHGSLFDSAALSERRLDELRELMSVVWTASSDALAVSVRHPVGREGKIRVETSVSPMAEGMLWSPGAGEDAAKPPSASGCSSELQVMRFDYESESCAGDFVPMTNIWAKGAATYDGDGPRCTGSADNSGFTELIRRAWLIQPTETLLNESSILIHELAKTDGSIIECESTVTRLGPNRLVVVVRDITERVARHKVEKELAVQSVARECDISANRFTRHEVKNGLLSGIGIVDAIGELRDEEVAASAPESQPLVLMKQCIDELAATLTTTLNSVLSETMARDLVHDTYAPVPELVDVLGLLELTHRRRNQQSNQFRFETWPAPLPPVVLDPQLLHCLHRNATSNACKYGDPTGEIVTKLTLRKLENNEPTMVPTRDDEDISQPKYAAYELTLEVVNKPGPKHAELLQVTQQAAQAKVFSQGSRMHPVQAGTTSDPTVSVYSVSSGDGGWIMSKCARAMGGDCDIHFNSAGTTFTMRCPTKRPVKSLPTSVIRPISREEPAAATAKEASEEAFQFPKGCWGIAIDDSKIQRKILAKLLGFAGIADDRVSVVGGTADEIHDFGAMVARHCRAHPDDYHLVIVDENLDYELENGCRSTVSGSLAIAELRQTLIAEKLEGKLLAIVRSANDSSADVAFYRKRAHGSLAKIPLKREMVLKTLAPIWFDRFNSTPTQAP